MKQINEFEEFGKQLPYKVPEGFFDSVTQITLELAQRRRIQSAKRRIFLSFAAAACLTVAVVAGWLISGETPEAQQAEVSHPLGQVEFPVASENTDESPIMDSSVSIRIESRPEQEGLPTPAAVTDLPEDLDLLLKQLSDEELKIVADGLLMDIYLDDLNQEEI